MIRECKEGGGTTGGGRGMLGWRRRRREGERGQEGCRTAIARCRKALQKRGCDSEEATADGWKVTGLGTRIPK